MLPRAFHLPRRLLGLLLVLVLFAPASSFGRVLYSCGMSGKLSTDGCCCQKAKLREARAEAAAGLRRQAKAERPSCCTAEQQRGAAVSASLVEAEAPISTASSATLLPIEPPVALVAAQQSFRARSIRGPPLGERVFIDNCAFLI